MLSENEGTGLWGHAVLLARLEGVRIEAWHPSMRWAFKTRVLDKLWFFLSKSKVGRGFEFETSMQEDTMACCSIPQFFQRSLNP